VFYFLLSVTAMCIHERTHMHVVVPVNRKIFCPLVFLELLSQFPFYALYLTKLLFPFIHLAFWVAFILILRKLVNFMLVLPLACPYTPLVS
jgi:hypothetical protein